MGNVISLDKVRQEKQFNQRAAGITDKLLKLGMNPLEAYRNILHINGVTIANLVYHYRHHNLYTPYQPNQQFLDIDANSGMLYTHVETLESRIIPGHYVQHRLVYRVSEAPESWLQLSFDRLELWKYVSGQFVFECVAVPEPS